MIYVYYMQVGNLPRDKTLKYVKERKAWLIEQKIFPEGSLLILPIRDGDGHTRIEVLPK